LLFTELFAVGGATRRKVVHVLYSYGKTTKLRRKCFYVANRNDCYDFCPAVGLRNASSTFAGAHEIHSYVKWVTLREEFFTLCWRPHPCNIATSVKIAQTTS